MLNRVMPDKAIEAAARKLCEMRGQDPDTEWPNVAKELKYLNEMLVVLDGLTTGRVG